MQSKTDIISRYLERDIRFGRFSAGEKLPSMRDLAKHYQVSTMVLHRAADVLEGKGLIIRCSRSGLFVAPSATSHQVFGILTTIKPQFMDCYYDAMLSCIRNAGGIAIPVLAGNERDICNMLKQNPIRVFIDLDSEHSYSLEKLNEILSRVPVTFFNRYEWDAPLPENAFLLDYVGMTVDTLRYFRSRGHEKILFLSHYHKPRPFKLRHLHKAGETVGLEFGSPEFQYCGRFDFENDPDRLVAIFRNNPPTAIFSRSDYLLFEFMQKVAVYFPECSGMERIGCFNSVWSRFPKQEFSTYDPCWEKIWKQAIAWRNGVRWFTPRLLERKPQSAQRGL